VRVRANQSAEIAALAKSAARDEEAGDGLLAAHFERRRRLLGRGVLARRDDDERGSVDEPA
jgi:hypothetical protein